MKDDFKEPAFVEPEEMAAKESSPAPEKLNRPEASKTSLTTKLKNKWGKASKNQRIAFVVAAVLVLSSVAFGIYQIISPKPLPPAPEPIVEAPKVEEPPKPTTEPSRLSGVEVSIELNQRSITGVMIENSVDARPQAGLKDAGVVFEAIAEGGITRFLALFQEGQPDYIGPVRSARPYYIDWLMGFDAAYTHAGGSGEALSLIRQLGIKDIEHGVNGGAFQRVSNRYAPHNLYTSSAALDAVKSQRGYNTSTFTSLARAVEAASATPNAISINLNPSTSLYAVRYDYSAATNSYNRVLAGRPHIDERSGAQLSPKVVVAMIVPYSINPNRIHSVYGTIGTGKATVFQNGIATEGTWTKADRASQIVLKDAAGNPIGLNPGQTWFTMLSSADKATFTGP
ncbi:MAG: DUF3048 domain-containing protein [bacterium]|nr:DUF3048 domain-containing protein [bacterium]